MVNAQDVKQAVENIVGVGGVVGGVIQAAMGLDEALFTTMPRNDWLAGLRPKPVGDVEPAQRTARVYSATGNSRSSS